MTTVQITLPDALANELDRGGYFAPAEMERLLREGLRARAVSNLRALRADLESDPIPPMTPEEVQAEIDAYRAEQRLARRT